MKSLGWEEVCLGGQGSWSIAVEGRVAGGEAHGIGRGQTIKSFQTKFEILVFIFKRKEEEEGEKKKKSF